MTFKKLIAKVPTSLIIGILVFSVLDSATHLLLLATINYKIGERLDNQYLEKYGLLIFTGTIILSIVCARVLQNKIIIITNKLLYKIETSLLNKLGKASLEDFENLGEEKVYTAINDANSLRSVPGIFIDVFNSLIIVICGLIYISLHSWKGALLITSIILILSLIYHKRNSSLKSLRNKLRDLQDSYYCYLKDLLAGFKQIKIDIDKNNNIFNFIRYNRTESLNKKIRISQKYMNNELLGEYSWFFILGLILFILPYFATINKSHLTAFIITVIYIVGPIGRLIAAINSIHRLKISMERLHEFEQGLSKVSFESRLINFADLFRSLSFRDVEYQYQKKEKDFSIGPLNIDILAGQIVFIVGSNGSGKSTFLKVLTGLYSPSRGHLLINNTTHENYPAIIQNQIAAIFSDNHLLSENYNSFNYQSHPSLSEYIDKLKLSLTLTLEKFGNLKDWQTKLSTGQKKRLAMILSLMEEKPILVLDEWASEQDPNLKKYFYTFFLPYLKSKGKTVIAVTHDSDFYWCADKVLQFDYGKHHLVANIANYE